MCGGGGAERPKLQERSCNRKWTSLSLNLDKSITSETVVKIRM